MRRPSSVEFSGKTKDKAAARASGHCEKCGMPFSGRRPHYDHILPAALGGKPELSNCQVLCEPCHKEKTAREDVPRIRKSDRQRKAANGASRKPSKIQSAPFQKSEKPTRSDRKASIDKSALLPLGASNIARRFGSK